MKFEIEIPSPYYLASLYNMRGPWIALGQQWQINIACDVTLQHEGRDWLQVVTAKGAGPTPQAAVDHAVAQLPELIAGAQAKHDRDMENARKYAASKPQFRVEAPALTLDDLELDL